MCFLFLFLTQLSLKNLNYGHVILSLIYILFVEICWISSLVELHE